MEFSNPDSLFSAQIRIRRLSRHLSDLDRSIMVLHLGGASVGRIADSIGLSKSAVHRRMKNALERLENPRVMALAMFGETLPEAGLQIAIAYFVEGLSHRELARRFRVGRRFVESSLDAVESWYQAGVQRAWRRAA